MTWPSDAAATGGDFDTTAPSPLGDQPKVFDQLPGTFPVSELAVTPGDIDGTASPRGLASVPGGPGPDWST